jgi:hypothetical protein
MPAVHHQKTVGTEGVNINGINQIQEIKQKKHRIKEGNVTQATLLENGTLIPCLSS